MMSIRHEEGRINLVGIYWRECAVAEGLFHSAEPLAQRGPKRIEAAIEVLSPSHGADHVLQGNGMNAGIGLLD
jgi:hypothetical protein